MVNKISREDLGHENYQWLDTHYHFSFANYFNRNRMGFGSLRVLNDDLIAPGTGFDRHPHKDMEIITYVIDGKLTHGDSMNNQETISRGHFQYMSAGTGIYHSEKNQHHEQLRLLQMWIFPDQVGLEPAYGDYKPGWDVRINDWYHVVSDKSGHTPLRINQDVNVYVSEFTQEMVFEVMKDRQAYIINIEGNTTVNQLVLNEGEALEVTEEFLRFKPEETSHVLIIEMKKETK